LRQAGLRTQIAEEGVTAFEYSRPAERRAGFNAALDRLNAGEG